MKEASEYIQAVSDYAVAVGTVEEKYKKTYEEIGRLNNLQSDLVHEIENREFTEEEALAKFAELKQMRKDRRKAINELRILEPLQKYCIADKQISMDAFRIKNEMNRIQKDNENWIYNPRVMENE